MARRLALLLLCLAALLPASFRGLARPRAPARPCAPQGRGEPPRGWVGCTADGGPPRDLSQRERLALGLPLDLNRAEAGELEWVPGLSRRLAEAVVAERAAGGPFASPDDLLRVKGIGPARLAKARPHVAVEPTTSGGWFLPVGP